MSLCIATWNVGRVYLEGIDSRVGDEDLTSIAGGVAATGADVVALQEVARAEQLGRLLALLGDGWRGAMAEGEPRDRHTWDPLESTCRHASLSIL